MSINNRELNTPQQRDTYQVVVANTASGASIPLCVMPYPAQVDAAGLLVSNATGVSGTPVLTLFAQRYLTAGVTIIGSIASTLTVAGPTLAQGFTINTGASQVLLQTGDVLFAAVSGANSSLYNPCLLSVSVRALQDIKTHFGN